MGIQADFIEADILEVKDRVKDKFDIVFASTGVLCWIPDLHRYAQNRPRFAARRRFLLSI